MLQANEGTVKRGSIDELTCIS